MIALELARGSLDWLLSAPRPADPTLYSGESGVVLAMLEGYHAFGDDAYASAAAQGARTIEHRVTPSDLEPQTGWAMGNAGIARELLRYARVAAGEGTRYVVDLPDHPPATTGLSGGGARSTRGR
jgi:hypothetical protein